MDSGYSKITSAEIYNFMSFKQAKIAFDESGIINVKGYNDSGKSAVLMAIAVCFMDIYKRNQVKFIRHGEDYFRVAVSFDDGVTIVRDKYLNGQNLYEMYENGNLIFTTKQGRKLSKIEGVPKPIEDYLGMCVTDLVYFNYQSCRDKLPLVDTKGSENYQMLHEVLRMEEIFRASQLINTDKNMVGNEVADLEVTLQRKEVLLERCKGVTQELVSKIEELEEEAKSNDEQKKVLEGIIGVVEKCDSFVEIPHIDEIGVSQFSIIDDCLRQVNSLLSIQDLPKVERVSCERLVEVNSLANLVNSLERIKKLPDIPKVAYDRNRIGLLNEMLDETENLMSHVEYPVIEEVGIDEALAKAQNLQKIMEMTEALGKLNSSILKADDEISKSRGNLDAQVDEAKAEGFKFVKCTNCGTYNVVGGEEANA